MCEVYIALQELQAVVPMLHRMAFQLSGKVVALHFKNSAAKAYFKKVVQHQFFLSFFFLADKFSAFWIKLMSMVLL